MRREPPPVDLPRGLDLRTAAALPAFPAPLPPPAEPPRRYYARTVACPED